MNEEKFRIESDLLGELQVPADAYYGVQTQRALNNYKISNTRMCDYPEYVIAMACIKLAAAQTNKELGALDAKIADARTDALHKVTTMLADENQVLCMENLNAKGMVRNHHLAKAVSDASFGEFARLLEYKCAERGRTLVKIGRFYPSSKTCSACGHRLDALPLSVRSWDCPACGAHHDRDVNAARNILTEGKRILSNTEGTAGHAGTVAAITA